MTRLSSTWLPRFLFWLSLAAALSMLLLVLAAPSLLKASAYGHGRARVLRLFAHDQAVRRITLASALGVLTTAWVFFRPRVILISGSRRLTATPENKD